MASRLNTYTLASDILSRLLHNLMVVVFQYGIVPSALEIAIITHILKKPTLDVSSPASYRPITVGSTFARLTEVLITKTHSLSDSQFGFRSRHSTGQATLFIND